MLKMYANLYKTIRHNYYTACSLLALFIVVVLYSQDLGDGPL